MRTVKEPDVRKQEILEGAIAVFAKKGYDRTTISDIAKELNISQGLCYRYFPSKEALKGRVSFSLNKDLVDQITSDTNYRKAEKKDKGLYQLFHSKDSSRLHDELSLRVSKKVLPIVRERLRRAKETGEITIDDPDGAAIAGVYTWAGVFMTDGLTDKERLRIIRSTWYTLLKL